MRQAAPPTAIALEEPPAPRALGDADVCRATLADLRPGQLARVASVDLASPIGRRLLDLGFVPGTEVRMVRRAPLGDPISFALRGTRIALRREEARRIRIDAAEDAAGAAAP